MAEGRDETDHPLGPRRPGTLRNASRNDIGNQGRVLLSRFIRDRLVVDGYGERPQINMLIEPGTPTGPPVEQVVEVADALRRIGDELDRDAGLQLLIEQVNPNAPHQTFMKVAKEIFSDGQYNWGRVTALFYFGYKMILKALQNKANELYFFRSIVEWIVQFIHDYVAPWIIERGGWESIQEYFGSTTAQAAGVLVTGLMISALIGAVRYIRS